MQMRNVAVVSSRSKLLAIGTLVLIGRLWVNSFKKFRGCKKLSTDNMRVFGKMGEIK